MLFGWKLGQMQIQEPLICERHCNDIYPDIIIQYERFLSEAYWKDLAGFSICNFWKLRKLGVVVFFGGCRSNMLRDMVIHSIHSIHGPKTPILTCWPRARHLRYGRCVVDGPLRPTCMCFPPCAGKVSEALPRLETCQDRVRATGRSRGQALERG